MYQSGTGSRLASEMTDNAPVYEHAPLLSPRFIWKVTAVVAALCLVTIAIAATGRVVGESIVQAGNTTDTTMHEIVVGNDVIRLPSNVICFEAQRVSGVQAAVDTYFAWPGMAGYSAATRDIFNQTRSADGLIFARIAQATMSRDMSGRFAPIYRRVIDGSPAAGPNGLDSYRMRSGVGYANELIYVERGGDPAPYVVRCLVEDAATEPDFTTKTGCQRDIALGGDLSVTYRFSIDLLPHWREIERDVRARLQSALVQQ